MAINIYTVQADVESAGWQLVSTTYKNLRTPMQFKCPKGHDVETTYDEWRKYKICPECHKTLTNSVVRNKILPKSNPNDYRVVALDAATGTSGFSVYDNKKLTSYGTFDTDAALDATARINQFKLWLDECIFTWKPDAVCVENIQLEKNVKMFQTLANLQGVILDYLYENEIPFQLVYASTWRTFLGINERDTRESAKKKAQSYVQMTCNLKCTQDEADAICIGRYAVNHIQKPRVKINWGEDIV